MARAYTVVTVALALNTNTKWVDNVLSHFTIEGVAQTRQGIARKISTEAIFRLALIQELSSGLGMPLKMAVAASGNLAQNGSSMVGAGVSLRLEREAALLDLQSRLDYAVESAPLPKRGRPPKNAKRGA